jgi:hypothetical protein
MIAEQAGAPRRPTDRVVSGSVLSFAPCGTPGRDHVAAEGRSYRNPAQRAVMLMLMGLREPIPARQTRKRDRQLELPFDDPAGPPDV